MANQSRDEHVSIIRCPRCRGTDRFQLLEQATVSRAILGVDLDGNIEVDGAERIETTKHSVYARLQCRNLVDGSICGHTWRLPSWAVRCLVYY